LFCLFFGLFAVFAPLPLLLSLKGWDVKAQGIALGMV
jgi:hypothetical protein